MAAVISMKEMAAIFNCCASVYDLLKEDNKEEGGRVKKKTIKGTNCSKMVDTVLFKWTS